MEYESNYRDLSLHCTYIKTYYDTILTPVHNKKFQNKTLSVSLSLKYHPILSSLVIKYYILLSQTNSCLMIDSCCFPEGIM